MKIEDFVRRVDLSRVNAAFLVVERLESYEICILHTGTCQSSGRLSITLLSTFVRVTPSTQQHFLLPIIQDANAKSVFFIFHVRPDITKIAEQIKQKAMRVHLHQLKPMQVRLKLLHICYQERVRSLFLRIAEPFRKSQ